jgi:hypothetical protein
MGEPLLTRLAKAVVFLAFIAVGIAGFFLGNPAQKSRASQDEACRVKCADLQKFHRLAPVSPGKPEGPSTCECY